jgi:hypothetical protein
VAIPRYFGSVVARTLDLVESLPEQGHQFAGTDVDPGRLADELIDAAEEGIERVDRAMSTKTNIDLFVACSDVHDADVEWGGDLGVGDLLKRVETAREKGGTPQRNGLMARRDKVDELIDGERRTLAEVEPAEAMWQETSELLTDTDPTDQPITTATMYFLTHALFDSIEELFDHEPLRRRMEKTVF